MHPILAGALAIGIFLFTVGTGMALICDSEVDQIIRSGAAESAAHLESLNDRAMTSLVIAGIGAGVALFCILVDEGRKKLESDERKSFFY